MVVGFELGSATKHFSVPEGARGARGDQTTENRELQRQTSSNRSPVAQKRGPGAAEACSSRSVELSAFGRLL